MPKREIHIDDDDEKGMTTGNPGKQIQSVQRAIDILNCFSRTNTSLSLSQISDKLNLNKGTVHGILNTLHNNGYVCQNSSGKYMLGAELFNKSLLAPDTKRSLYIDQAKKYMQKLSNQFQANASLFAVEDKSLLLLHATEPTNCAFIVRRATSHITLYCSASGKIVLAYTSEKICDEYLQQISYDSLAAAKHTTRQKLYADFKNIKKNGYSVENNDLFEGVSALAVPIFSGSDSNQLFGTLSLTGMSAGIMRQRKEIIKSLKETALSIEQEIVL